MSLTKNGKFGIVAVVAVALVAAGAAYAATTFHGKGSSQARGGFGGPGAGMGRGYGGPGGFGAPGAGAQLGRGFRGGGGPFGELSAAASYLGVSQSSLFQSLRSGKTLAQIADATSGKSESGLVAALVSAETTEIDAAVKAGRISQSQADQLTSNLKTRITSFVEGKGRGFGRGSFGGPPGGGYGGGFGGPPSQSGGTQPNHI